MERASDEAAESAAEATRTQPPRSADTRPEDPPATRAALLERARTYASTVDIAVDTEAIEWELSERARRRAGVCLFDRRTETVTIRLTWAAYEEYGWAEFTAVIRHELVHAWEFQHYGESTHGGRFKEKAAELDVPRHCRSFSDARLLLRCPSDDCSWRAERHRASKAVTNPEKRRCGNCRARYVVKHVETGECWETNAEYRRARERIGDDW